MKRRYIIKLSTSWRWLIDSNSSRRYKFTAINGLTFINPIFYRNYINQKNTFPFHKIGDNILIQCNILLFEFANYNEENVKGFDFDLEKFFKFVRYVSKQVSIDFTNSLTSISYPVKPFKLDKVEFNTKDEIYKSKFNSRFVTNLIKWQHIKEANSLIKKNYTIPIYEDILLDALDGFYKNDSRKTIIYSAIAIESMIAIKLDEYFEENRNLKNKNSYRIVEFNTSNGKIFKDPIFKKLCEKTNFSSLLHERPLYVMNKSLLIENKNLYKDALSLYTTRNKIVHLGEPNQESSNQLLEINIEGALKAFNIAIEIFEWMNITGYQKVKQLEFVELN